MSLDINPEFRDFYKYNFQARMTFCREFGVNVVAGILETGEIQSHEQLVFRYPAVTGDNYLGAAFTFKYFDDEFLLTYGFGENEIFIKNLTDHYDIPARHITRLASVSNATLNIIRELINSHREYSDYIIKCLAFRSNILCAISDTCATISDEKVLSNAQHVTLVAICENLILDCYNNAHNSSMRVLKRMGLVDFNGITNMPTQIVCEQIFKRYEELKNAD